MKPFKILVVFAFLSIASSVTKAEEKPQGVVTLCEIKKAEAPIFVAPSFCYTVSLKTVSPQTEAILIDQVKTSPLVTGPENAPSSPLKSVSAFSPYSKR